MPVQFFALFYWIKMTELFTTRDAMSDTPMTVVIERRTKSILIQTIDKVCETAEEFNAAWEAAIARNDPSNLMNIIPLTERGAERLLKALKKALETED